VDEKNIDKVWPSHGSPDRAVDVRGITGEKRTALLVADSLSVV